MEPTRLAAAHARDLLARLGRAERPDAPGEHPALGWRRSGLMAVTGHADGPGLVAPCALTAAADGALMALQAIAPGAQLPVSGAALLGERARLLGLGRHGAISANRACRLIAAADGWFALNLPRAEDRELLPALLGEPAADWADVDRLAERQDCAALVAQGRLLGLAIARAQEAEPVPFTVRRFAAPRPRDRPPLVVDLSALWAGPLAGSLLGLVGAHVVKVESCRRPDGARGGDPRFYDLLNAGKASVALDFADAGDRAHLWRLVAAADIVIEASRPRALAALGIDAEATARAGTTWVSITAHGRIGEAAGWIGYGDDAAVAGGISAAMARAWGAPLFAGDAIADPLTGLTAALAAWAGWLGGGGQLVSLALSGVAAHAARLHETAEVATWQALAETDTAPLYPLRAAPGPARASGADTMSVLKTLRGGTISRSIRSTPV